MFETDSKEKYRYPTVKGAVPSELLWDMPLKNERTNYDLNTVAKTLSAEVRAADEEDFVGGSSTPENTEAANKLAIVKHIIAYKKDAKAKAEQYAINKSNNARIDEIIASKQDEALSNLSVEELLALKK